MSWTSTAGSVSSMPILAKISAMSRASRGTGADADAGAAPGAGRVSVLLVDIAAATTRWARAAT